MRTILVLLIFLTVFLYCSEDIETTKEQDAQKFELLFAEIKTLSTSIACVDSSEWTFTAFGSKPCGGPTGYIAYSSKIDTILFLRKIEEYTVAQENFNKKWGIISDCAVTPAPSKVVCNEGKPVLEY